MIAVKAFKTVLTWYIFLFCMTAGLVAQETAGTAEASEIATEAGALLNTPREVDGLLQWRKQLDLSGLDPGRYNLLVTAEDAAGNILEAPPVDIRVDPESDLPHSSVTYPALNERVAGNFSVLGSAVDDDGVSSVSYLIVPGKDAQAADAAGFREAEGKEFWSASVDVSELEDGPYTVVSRATDVNGLTGPETSVSFVLDRNIPDIRIESHENGALVSGRLKISGTVSDFNGIGSMQQRSGEQWREIRLKGRDGLPERSFSVDVDTRELEDGPRVLVFRAEDSQGSRSRASLLLFVDNTPPQLNVVYPAEDLQANGRFSVLGLARDDNGIESLSWAYRGEEPVEIEMEPGNPYWEAPVELSGAEDLDLEFTLTDPAGNKTNIRYRKKLDVEADRPGIRFAGALGQADQAAEDGLGEDGRGEDRLPSYKAGEQISGWVLDDDSPGAVVYSLNRGEETRLDTTRSFHIDISGLSPGEHELRIRAEDIYGLQNEEQAFSFLLEARKPDVEMEKVLPRQDDGDSESPSRELAYEPGIGFASDEYALLEGRVTFHSGKGRAVASIPGREDVELKLEELESDGEARGTSWKFQIPLEDTRENPLSYGFVPVKIRSIDESGAVSEDIFPLWIENLTQYRGEPSLQLPRTLRGNSVILSEGEQLELGFFGQDIASAELSPERSAFRLQASGNRLSISTRGSGILESGVVSITTDRGGEYSRQLPLIVSDREAPSISLEETARSGEAISGSVRDDTEIRRLWYVSADSEDAENDAENPIRFDGDGSFRFTVPDSLIVYPGSMVTVYAEDAAGRVASRSVLVSGGGANEEDGEEDGVSMRLLVPASSSVDALLPEDLHGQAERLLLPIAVASGGIESGTESVGNENGRNEYGSEIRITLNGGEPRSIAAGPAAIGEIPSPGSGKHQLKAELPYTEFREGDEEGRERSISATLNFTIAPESPVLRFNHEQLEFIPRYSNPESGPENASVSGSIGYEGDIDRAFYVLDEGDEISLNLQSMDEGGYAFSIPLTNREPRLRAGRRQVKVHLVDEFGREISSSLDFHLTESNDERLVDDREGWYPLEERNGDYSYLFNGRPPVEAVVRAASEAAAGANNGTRDEAALPETRIGRAGSSWIVELNPGDMLRWDQLELAIETEDAEAFARTIQGVSFDTQAPELTLDTPLEGENLNELLISGSVVDNDAGDNAGNNAGDNAGNNDSAEEAPGAGPVLSYSLNGGEFRQLSGDPSQEEGRAGEANGGTGEANSRTGEANGRAGEPTAFSYVVTEEEMKRAGADDAVLELIVRAQDASGNSTEVRRLLTFDTRGPEIEQILPADEVVNGRNSLFFLTRDEFSHGLSGRFALSSPAAELAETSETGETGESADGAEETAGESQETASGTELQVEEKQSEHGVLDHLLDLSPYGEMPDQLFLELSDSAGNTRRVDVSLNFDPASDKPKISMEFPETDALFQTDALFSGTVIDDDGVDSIRYRLDDGDYRRADTVEGANSFEILIPFDELEDNEHVLDVIAVDIYGVESDVLSTPFRVSREKPRAQLLSPELGSTNGSMVSLEGSASDANGIDSVWISLDGGNSFQKTRGGETWSYDLDSSILVDRSYLMLIKAVDAYGVESVSSSIITLDNTPPAMELSLPREGSEVERSLPVQLRVSDELAVADISYRITPLESTAAPGGEGESGQSGGRETMLSGEFAPRRVVLEQIDISGLEPGLYNLSIFARDDAENESMVSRDIIRVLPENEGRLSLLHPFDGSSVAGGFTLEGRAFPVDGEIPAQVLLTMDGSSFDVLSTDDNGYFSRSFEPGEISDGSHLFAILPDAAAGSDVPADGTAGGNAGGGEGTDSGGFPQSRIDYSAEGPWVSIDSLSTGDFASQRPWISGRTGYYREGLSAGQLSRTDDGRTGEGQDSTGLSRRELRAIEKQYELVSLEYSLDNGSSFTSMRPREEWKFRLETQDLNDGPLSIMVRSRFASGETAVSRIFTRVDDTLPRVSIITPEENIAVNEELEVSGTASDENGLKDVRLTLRPRSKNSYEVPQFIQGLYLDLHVLGATYWETGLGLTFFDNNVKLQVLGGQAPEGRFNGNVLGLKLLANVASLPYGFLFGPDWEFLSSSLAVGSAFQYFTMDSSASSGGGEEDGLVLGAVIVQLEVLKVEIEQWNAMNAYAAYVENQFWFISSDIQGGIKYRLAFGMRINLF